MQIYDSCALLTFQKHHCTFKKTCLHKSPGRQKRGAKIAEEACPIPHVHTHTHTGPGKCVKGLFAFQSHTGASFLYRLSIIIKSTSCDGPSNSSPLRRFHSDRVPSITLKTVPSPAATGGSVPKGEAPSLTPPHSASTEADPGSCPGDARPA